MPRRKEGTIPAPIGKRDNTIAVTVTLPVSVVLNLEQERSEAAEDPGRSGLVARILADHYTRREKELVGVA